MWTGKGGQEKRETVYRIRQCVKKQLGSSCQGFKYEELIKPIQGLHFSINVWYVLWCWATHCSILMIWQSSDTQAVIGGVVKYSNICNSSQNPGTLSDSILEAIKTKHIWINNISRFINPSTCIQVNRITHVKYHTLVFLEY